MKRLPLLLAPLLLATSTVLLAQEGMPPPGGGPPPRVGLPPVEVLAKELNLQDWQKAELQRIFDEHREKVESEFQQARASGQRPSREQMKQHQEELLQQVSGVLDVEQLAKYKELMAHRVPAGPPGARRVRPPDGE